MNKSGVEHNILSALPRLKMKAAWAMAIAWQVTGWGLYAIAEPAGKVAASEVKSQQGKQKTSAKPIAKIENIAVQPGRTDKDSKPDNGTGRLKQIKPALPAKQAQTATVSKPPKSALPAKANKAGRHDHSAGHLMVPPPPPEIPLVGDSEDGRVLTTLGVPLDYMSRADLQNMQQRLQASEVKLKKEVSDRDQLFQDKQQRAAQFADLFKEGVVSRKELESARRELADLDDHGADVNNRLKDVQTDIQKVSKQLAALDQKAKLKAASVPKNKPMHKSGRPRQ